MKKLVMFSTSLVNASIDLSSPVKRVLDSHWYVLGTEVSHFENEFAEYNGVRHCVSVANGTDALELGLRAVDIKAGDSVIATANAGFYSSTAIRLIGAKPVYVDMNPATHTLCVDALQKRLELDKPKAIIATHLFGQLADIERVVEIADRAGIPVIEDCAQSHGAMRNGKRAGSFGTIGCFSFYPTKNLGALGDGGAVITNDTATAEKLRQYRQYGWSSKYCVDLPGGRNSRLDEIQAAILREKLPHLERQNTERRDIARKYNKAFEALPLICPSSLGDDYVAHLYVMQISNRDEFRSFLKQHGIVTDVYYPIPDHLQKAYVCEQEIGSLPLTEASCNKVVSLPCFPGMISEDVDRVISAVILYFKSIGE
jgi:aminotransferase EvaB